MQAFLIVFFAGGIGSALRYGTGLLGLQLMGPGFPWGTLAVNLIGCTAIGVFARTLPLPDEGIPTLRLLLMTGLLGGYTTFSAFSLDAATLWMRNEAGAAITYVGVSVLGSLACVAMGLFVGKALVS